MIAWFSLVPTSLLIFGGRGVDATAMRRRQEQPTTTTTSTSPTSTPGYFSTSWQINGEGFPSPPLPLEANTSLSYTVADFPPAIAAQGELTLALLWTNASSSTTPDSSNTWEVTNIAYSYPSLGFAAGGTANLNLALDPQQQAPQSNGTVNNFFLCFSTGVDASHHALTCESYSPFFDIQVGGSASFADGPAIHEVAEPAVVATSLSVPTVTISVTMNTAFVTKSGDPLAIPSQSQTPTSGPTTTAGLYTTTSIASGTTTITPSPTASTTPVQSKSKSLSTGPLVGIIVGGIGAIVIFSFLVLLCLRRRRRSRNNNHPEQVLLTQNMHSESRDLITEKSGSPSGERGLASIPNSPLARPSIPQNPRHSYDSLNASAPYSGLAAAIPRRKASPPDLQVQQVQRSHSPFLLSRGISDASGRLTDVSGAISPRSTVRGEQDGESDDLEEPYHDVPIYGDARHTPTIYQSSTFLNEPGMSAEEVARLEEEERRIDAAIAEAEGRR